MTPARTVAGGSRLVAVAQARSCGATTATLALAVAWPARVLVAELDPAGGDLAVRFGLSANTGVLSLAATGAERIGADTVAEHTQVADGLSLLVGPPGAEQAAAALGGLGPALAEALGAMGNADVLVDCGRLAPASAVVSEILPRATLVLLVAATTPAGVVHLRHRLAALPPAVAARTTVALVGEGRPGCRAPDVERALGVEVAGVLADDWRGAEALAAGEVSTRRYRSSALARSARPLARALAARLGPPPLTRVPPAPAPSGPVSATPRPACPRTDPGGRSMANSAVRHHEGMEGQ